MGSDTAVDDTVLLDKEVSKLSHRLAEAQNEYIVALENRDKADAQRLEEELERLTEKRDAFAEVSARKKEEHLKRTLAGGSLGFLIYVSRFSRELELEEVSHISRKSSNNNRQVGITGTLLVNIAGSQFIQYLEGDIQTVDSVFEHRIKNSPEHTDIIVIRRQLSDKRKFPDWPMRIIDIQQYEGEEQPIQTVLTTVAKFCTISSSFLQPTIRSTLVRGGNPLYLQPERRKVIIMQVCT